MDKDVVAPVRWCDEAVAFGAGETFAHAGKHRTFRRTCRPVHGRETHAATLL